MKNILLIFFIFFQLTVFGQKEPERKIPKSDPNYVKYLDDGKLDLAKTALKVDVSNILNTEIGVLLEQQILRGFAIQAGAAIIPKYIGFRERLSNSNARGDSIQRIGYQGNGVGSSFTIMPKFYLSRNGITDGIYIGLKYKQQTIPLQFNGTAKAKQYQLIFGSQFIFYKKMALDYGLGIGYRSVTPTWPKGADVPEFEVGNFDSFTYSIHLGIGIYLGKSQVKNVDTSTGKSKKSNKKENSDEE